MSTVREWKLNELTIRVCRGVDAEEEVAWIEVEPQSQGPASFREKQPVSELASLIERAEQWAKDRDMK